MGIFKDDPSAKAIARLRELLAAANATTCEAQDCHYFGKLRSSSCECERDRKQDVERLRYRAVSALPALLDCVEAAKAMREEVDRMRASITVNNFGLETTVNWADGYAEAVAIFDAALKRLEDEK